MADSTNREHPGGSPIAIVGMACRFPGGPDLSAFWHWLESGGYAVTQGRPDGLTLTAESAESAAWGAYLTALDRFDAEFFRIAPVEAELLDPQQRLLLETSWEALEDAGLDPGELRGSRTSAYAGLWRNDYRSVASFERDPTGDFYLTTGTSFSTAIGRVAYTLGLEGPAIAVDTACSSSLVAIHQAAAGLQRGEADLALAGGVNAVVTVEFTRQLAAVGMLAPDGRCRTFDAAAKGFVRGEGCGMLVLKRLADAERDGDRIQGVLLGSAVNQDGASAGLTVPNGPAQERVIAEALARAGVAPAEVDYLEAHGTGTELGDPIEVQAAAAAYGKGRPSDRPLLLGSVKTNIGHLEAAAGVAGVIKVLLSMRAGVIPKHLHFERPNPRMDWERLPVRVTSSATAWPSPGDRPLRAGVSSFGFSGTNAHVILESYGPCGDDSGRPVEVRSAGGTPADDASLADRTVRLLPLSARSGEALRQLAGRWVDWLEARSDSLTPGLLSDAAWTAGVGRSHFGRRAGLVFEDGAGLRAQLEALAAGEGRSGGGSPGKVAFLFTGQGSQWAGMGRDLYEREPVARAVLDRCEEAFREERGSSLLAVMFGAGASGDAPGDSPGDLDATAWTQPALYALEAALAAQWSSVGVVPDVVLGHSVGEVAAAQAAGAIGLEAGLRFASRRGMLMGSLPRTGASAGGMAAVFASSERVRAAVEESNAGVEGAGLCVAADNGAHQVVSGPLGLLSALEARLRHEGVRAERLATSHAFHSGLMDPALAEIEAAARDLAASEPSLPLVSNVTGGVVEGPALREGGYWRRQARSPVAFGAGVRTLAALGVGVVVEVGPRAVLGPMAGRCWPASGAEADASKPVVLSSLDGPAERGPGFVHAVAKAWEANLGVKLAGLFAGERRRRVALPTYPFQRRRYWVEKPKRRRTSAGDPRLGGPVCLANGQFLFETELSASTPDWLNHSRVFDRVVAPGALYAAEALRALAAVGPQSGARFLEGVRIETPLALQGSEPDDGEGERVRLVQLVLGATEVGSARTFEIFSRAGNDEPWVRHANGRAGFGAPADGKSVSSSEIEFLKSALSPVDSRAMYRNLAEAGLSYGPALRGIAGAWLGPAEAVGEVALPEGVDGTVVEIQLAVLEACFQLAARVVSPEGSGDGETAWLAAGWERLWVGGGLPERVLCRVRKVSRTADAAPDARTLDLDIYALDGTALGGVSGFTLERVSRAALLSATAGMEDLLYRVEWREASTANWAGPRPADFLEGPAAVASGAPDVSEHLRAEGLEAADAAALGRDLEKLSHSYALSALEELGWERRAGAVVDPEALRRELKIVEQHRHLLGRLLAMLGEARILERRGDDAARVLAVGSGDRAAPLEAPARLADELAERHPYGEVEIGLLRLAGSALADVLRGRADGLNLLFGGEPSAADLYHAAPAYRVSNRMVAAAVSAAAAGLPDGRRLRMLEVGAGTGGTTAAVLAELPEGRTDYTYTDISAGFFAMAEARFGDVGADMDYRVLDIEREPSAQGFDAHGYDIVLAANVLHATRDLGETLRHCRRLLAPSGMLVLLEIMEARGWPDLPFGVLDGWWRFDDAYRSDDPLVGPRVWRQALAEAGYGEVDLLAPAAGNNGGAVILARGPARVRPEPGLWVLFDGDGGSLAADLTGELEGWGQRVVATDGAGPGVRSVEPFRRESWRELFAGTAVAGPLRGVVHLGGLRGKGAGAEAEAAEMAGDVERVVRSALAMAQGLEDSGVRPTAGLWFVTSGGQMTGEETSGQLAGSALWGFGRRAARELTDIPVRLLDLDPASPGSAAGLARELAFPDRESEVAWWAGRRLVSRLVRLPSGSEPDAGSLPGRVRADRSYLVTGGLSGFGLQVADWLADAGAGGVVLQGSADAAAEAVIDSLRSRGVAVRVAPVEVTGEASVARLLSEMADGGLPLGGLFHGPGAPSERSLVHQDWESCKRVLWPTVLAAWHLHRAALPLKLDIFVLFSSLGGVLGHAGGAPDAAASAFLDQLARYRRAGGLPGQAIQWEPWSAVDGGVWQREATGPSPDGVGRLTPEQGRRTLTRLVDDDVGTAVAAWVDWSMAGGNRRRRPALLEDLVSGGGRESVLPGPADLPSRLRSAAAAEREGVLAAFLREQVRSVLRLPSLPSAEVGFFDLGMDSLMAAEFQGRLNRALAGEYKAPSTVVFDHPNVTRLARHLAAKLGCTDPEPGEEGRSPDRAIQREYERVQQMQEEDFLAEANALLETESKPERHGGD